MELSEFEVLGVKRREFGVGGSVYLGQVQQGGLGKEEFKRDTVLER